MEKIRRGGNFQEVGIPDSTKLCHKVQNKKKINSFAWEPRFKNVHSWISYLALWLWCLLFPSEYLCSVCKSGSWLPVNADLGNSWRWFMFLPRTCEGCTEYMLLTWFCLLTSASQLQSCRPNKNHWRCLRISNDILPSAGLKDSISLLSIR